MGHPDSDAITISFVTTCPKNARSAVRFSFELSPSWPRMNSRLSFRGDGRLRPAMPYTPSEYAEGAFLVKCVSESNQAKIGR